MWAGMVIFFNPAIDGGLCLVRCLTLSASVKTNGYERCLGAFTADADIRSRDSFSEPRGYFKGAEAQAKRSYKQRLKC